MSRPAQDDFWHRRWLGWLGWAFIASLVLACGWEWEHYRRLFAWQKMGFSAWQKWVLLWTLWAKTLVLFVPWLVLAGLVARRRTRAGGVVLMLLAALLLGWLVIDLKTEAVTGNHVSTYLAQADLNSLQFAGGAGWMAKYLALYLTSAVVLVFVSCALVCTLVRQRFWPVNPAMAMGLYATAMVGVVPAWIEMRAPDVLTRLHGELPVSFSWLGLPRKASVRMRAFAFPFEQSANASLAAIGERWQIAAPADEREVLTKETRPNVVLVLIESWRADALNPTWMPELDAWSQRGLRFTNHYAGGNCSPMGLFELLYGRSCLAYSRTLNAHILPQSCVTFHRSGYRVTYLSTLDDTSRLRGGEFLNKRAFDRVSVSHDENWNSGDRWTIREAQRTLREGGGQPQFVVLFLASTHHPYPCPTEGRKFQPVLRDGWSILDADLSRHLAEMRNSYANSAAFMDAEVSSFLGSLDLSRTIVAVTGDHGESLFTDGTASHSSRLSPIQTQVPMFLLGAGIPTGKVNTLSINADTLPTVLHAAAQRPVKLSGVSGIDLLDETERRRRSSLILGGFQWTEPFDAALVRPEGRLALGISISTLKVEANGFLNDRGEIDAASQPPVAQASAWARELAEQIERIATKPAAEAVSASKAP